MGGERQLALDIADYIYYQARESNSEGRAIVSVEQLCRDFEVTPQFIRERKAMIELSLNLEEDVLDATYVYSEMYDGYEYFDVILF